MQTDFWTNLLPGFGVLAPMEDVTDTVFRQMVKRIAPADVYVTEFTSVDGIEYAISDLQTRMLSSTPPTVPSAARLANPVLRRLVFSEVERPVVAQIWGSDPEKFFVAAKYVASLGFDGIDINFGCPQRDIMKCGGGAANIGNFERVGEILTAVSEGSGGLPLSVKTRLGIKKMQTEEWIGWLLQQKLSALTVHLRTAAEMSAVPAHWEVMPEIVKMRESGSQTKIIGNGDVKDRNDGETKCNESGCDGFMIGRGVLSNPGAFANDNRVLTIEERRGYLQQHIELWMATWGSKKDFSIMKKFVKAYINGFEGAVEMRIKFMETKNFDEMLALL